MGLLAAPLCGAAGARPAVPAGTRWGRGSYLAPDAHLGLQLGELLLVHYRFFHLRKQEERPWKAGQAAAGPAAGRGARRIRSEPSSHSDPQQKHPQPGSGPDGALLQGSGAEARLRLRPSPPPPLPPPPADPQPLATKPPSSHRPARTFSALWRRGRSGGEAGGKAGAAGGALDRAEHAGDNEMAAGRRGPRAPRRMRGRPGRQAAPLPRRRGGASRQRGGGAAPVGVVGRAGGGRALRGAGRAVRRQAPPSVPRRFPATSELVPALALPV